MRPARIASLVPSGTDLVAELGRGEALVGVSHQCDNPVARGRPVLTTGTIPATGTGGGDEPSPFEVDRAVADAVRAGQPLYRTDLGLLRRLRPEVVVAQDVCDVCAVSGDRVGAELPAGAELVSLEATTLPGLEDDVARLGKAIGAEDAAGAVLERLRADLRSVREAVAGLPRRRALVLEWGDPPFLGGHWVPELVALAGGEHVLAGAGQPSRRSTWDEVRHAVPEVVVFAPCGYTLAAAEGEARRLRRQLPPGIEWWAAHATALLSRCTPAAVTAAARVLAGALHPGAAPPPWPHLAVRLS